MDRIPLKAEPKLMDAVIQQMQVALGGGLTWLDHVFGKAERVEHNISELKQYYQKHMHEEPFYTPAVYVGGGKYERIVPDMPDWGNYAFFYLDRRQEVTEQAKVPPYFHFRGEVSLVVWGDSRDIEAEDDRNLESIKLQVWNALGAMRLTDGHVRWTEVIENSEEVFSEYSIKEAYGKLLMWPYFGFRFVGEISCDTSCIATV